MPKAKPLHAITLLKADHRKVEGLFEFSGHRLRQGAPVAA